MLQALGHLLPLALAIAISSVPITATILILLSPKRNTTAIPFLIGWVFGMALLVVLVDLLANVLPQASRRQTPYLAVAEIVIGVAMIALALISWRVGRGKERASQDPAWLRAVGSVGALPAFGIAFALNFRPKGFLLGLAAGLAVHAANLSPGSAAVTIATYTIIGASTVALPIMFTLVNPVGMQPRLVTARSWLTTNSHIVTVVILLMIGVVIFGSGLSDL
ncbi:MAG: hypothetical protein JWQ19_663 [Subtercola sp.]|nr:hypothetical protein [Subtercola sp.]